MASRGRATAARFWLLAAASLLVAAASARSGPGECTSALVSLSPCVDYMCGDEATAALGRYSVAEPAILTKVDRTNMIVFFM